MVLEAIEVVERRATSRVVAARASSVGVEVPLQGHGTHGETADDRGAAGLSQVDDDALLAAVERFKIARKTVCKAAQHPPGVTAWRLDFQHLGPQLCQHHRGRGPLLVAREVQNLDACKGPRHLFLLWYRL